MRGGASSDGRSGPAGRRRGLEGRSAPLGGAGSAAGGSGPLRVLAPFSRAREVAPCIEAGADELYCGLITPLWRSRYTNMAANSAEEASNANLPSVAELARSVAAAHDRGVPVFLAVNAPYFTDEQYPLVLEEVAAARGAGVDAVIVADPGLMASLRDMDRDLPVHVSIMLGVYNWRAALLCRSLGASRLVLPYDLTLEEMGDLAERTRGSGLELETFVLNGRCMNSEAFCTFNHAFSEQSLSAKVTDFEFAQGFLWGRLGAALDRLPRSLRSVAVEPYQASCLLSYDVEARGEGADGPGPRETEAARRSVLRKLAMNRERHWLETCRLCALPALRRMGVRSLKIEGRVLPTAKKVQDVRLARAAVRLLEEGEEGFEGRLRELYRRHRGASCARENCCMERGG